MAKLIRKQIAKPAKKRQSMFVLSVKEGFDSLMAVRWLMGILLIVGSSYYSYLSMWPNKKQYEHVLSSGFQNVRSIGTTHFLVVEDNFVNDRDLQSHASEQICDTAGQNDYCEVYIYRNAEDVPSELPIIRGADKVVGMYKRVGNDVKFRLLHDGGFNPAKGKRVSPKIIDN